MSSLGKPGDTSIGRLAALTAHGVEAGGQRLRHLEHLCWPSMDGDSLRAVWSSAHRWIGWLTLPAPGEARPKRAPRP